MAEELKEIGLDIGHRRVGLLMRQNDISVIRPRKHNATTDSNHKFNVAPNLLDRNYATDGPNPKWAGDITYIWKREGWLYLAVILDLHSRRVIVWAVSNRMKRDLTIRALKPFGTLLRNLFKAPGRGPAPTLSMNDPSPLPYHDRPVESDAAGGGDEAREPIMHIGA